MNASRTHQLIKPPLSLNALQLKRAGVSDEATFGKGKESGFSCGEQEGYDRGYKDGERARNKELKQGKEALAAYL